MGPGNEGLIFVHEVCVYRNIVWQSTDKVLDEPNCMHVYEIVENKMNANEVFPDQNNFLR